MLKNLRQEKKGFASMVEIIVTAVIFILAAFGIITTISMLRPQGSDSERRLLAAYIGKQKLDELRGYIDTRMWDNAQSPLAVNVLHSSIINGYNVTWYLTDDPVGVRKVQMNISTP